MAGAFLRVVSGARQGLSVPLRADQPLLIGRSRGDLIIDDPLVSGAHCRIVSRNGKYLLQDLGSTNGSSVDGRRVQEAPLRAGSEIVLGSTRLLLFAGDEAEVADPAESAGKVAWLLEEELAAGASSAAGAEDLIGQGLRVPPRFDGRVEVVAGPDLGRVYRFTRGSLTIGRRQGEIPLTDVEISRKHAYIEVFGVDMVFLRDVYSTNGTYHNGRRVQMSRLISGDTIGVGKTVMRYFGS
jgi:pSer/pThr/pTyr-binding forkhead associated (FHA) protein